MALCAAHRWNLARLNRKLAKRDEAEQLSGPEAHGDVQAMDHLAAFPVGFRYVL